MQYSRMWAASKIGKINIKMKILLWLVCIVALLGTGCGRQRAVEVELAKIGQTENGSETGAEGEPASAVQQETSDELSGQEEAEAKREPEEQDTVAAKLLPEEQDTAAAKHEPEEQDTVAAKFLPQEQETVDAKSLPGQEEEAKSVSGEEQDSRTGKTQSTELEIVRIAVIDTGFSTEAIPEEKREEGKNYVEPEGSVEDTYGHGTAVASVILSENENVVLIPLVSNVYEKGRIRQVENDTLAQMIRDAVDVYQCSIINISAGLVLDKEAVREAVKYARKQGVLIVASAGNDYDVNGAVKYYPAGYDSVLAVGALTKDGKEVASFSQRGDWVNCYEIGEAVTIKTLSGKTRESDGTSYAAAKITARAAELMQEEPTLTVDELQESLETIQHFNQ